MQGKLNSLASVYICKSVVVDEQFEFCGQELIFTDTVVHLGHNLLCDLSDYEDIENDFIRRANCLLGNF